MIRPRLTPNQIKYAYPYILSLPPFVRVGATVAGVPFTSLSQILPFILIGIGVDDMVRSSTRGSSAGLSEGTNVRPDSGRGLSCTTNNRLSTSLKPRFAYFCIIMILPGMLDSASICAHAVRFCQLYPSRGCVRRGCEKSISVIAAQQADAISYMACLSVQEERIAQSVFVLNVSSSKHSPLSRLLYGALHLNVPRASLALWRLIWAGYVCPLSGPTLHHVYMLPTVSCC